MKNFILFSDNDDRIATFINFRKVKHRNLVYDYFKSRKMVNKLGEDIDVS